MELAPNYRVLLVEYEGTNYCGFQLQKEEPTIQRELEQALKKLTGQDIRVMAASRTDSGVHARGQLVGFRAEVALPLGTYVRGMNYYLPKDIVVKRAYTVGPDFRLRSGARSRLYRYCLFNRAVPSPFWQRWSHWVRQPLNMEAMQEASQFLVGCHDFSAFASPLPDSQSSVRTVYRAEVRREENLVFFEVEANSFLPHQVRRTVGALVEVGLGRSSPTTFEALLRWPRPSVAGPALPAQGLFLMQVNHPGVEGNVEKYPDA